MASTYPQRPLDGFPLVESVDSETVRSAVGSAFCDYRLSPRGGSADLDAHFNGVQLQGAGLYYLEYGTDVRIDLYDLVDCYLVQIPLAGSASVSVGTDDFISNPERASLLEPGRRASMKLDRANQHLILRLDQKSVQTVLRKKLGREPLTAISFDSQMDLTTPGNQNFRNLLQLFAGAVNLSTTTPTVALGEFQGLLISQLILGQPNNYGDELHLGPRPAVARPIARAAEMIEAHAREPLTVDDIAEAVGIGARALQEGFRRHFDTTPTMFLRDIRLQRVRTALMQADSTSTTVTEIALEWGFLHLGRFAVMYNSRFGETPSSTLRFGSDRSTGPIRL